jgi:DNA-binding MarR family transcriptional regulator
MAQKAFDLSNSPGHLLRRCQQWAFDLYTKEVGLNGLTPRQFTVLAAVEQNEGASQTDLVDLTGIDRSTLADMISRMIKKELLARKRTDEDQRANAVRITTKGSKALRGVVTAVSKAELRILDPLPAGRRIEFLKSLSLIADAARDSDGSHAEGNGKEKPSGRRGRKPKR